MANFQQAVQWLKEGKKVRKKSWGNYYIYSKEPRMEIYLMPQNRPEFFGIVDFEAKDWEIFEENKLKTLKDLEYDLEWNLGTINGLRQEAIKWAKIGTYMLGPMSSETKEFIKYFFNITEEELR